MVPVPNLSRAVVQAIQVGRALSDDIQVVHVTDDRDEGERLRERFEEQFPGVPFVIVESPYRSLVRPFVTYLDVTSQDKEAMTLIIIPEYVADHWWEQILYNQTSKRLRRVLLGRPDTVIAAVPYRRERKSRRPPPGRSNPTGRRRGCGRRQRSWPSAGGSSGPDGPLDGPTVATRQVRASQIRHSGSTVCPHAVERQLGPSVVG